MLIVAVIFPFFSCPLFSPVTRLRRVFASRLGAVLHFIHLLVSSVIVAIAIDIGPAEVDPVVILLLVDKVNDRRRGFLQLLAKVSRVQQAQNHQTVRVSEC